jgi:hypothetical protein
MVEFDHWHFDGENLAIPIGHLASFFEHLELVCATYLEHLALSTYANGDTQPAAAAVAFRARHVKHYQLAGDIAEHDRAAAADFQPGLYDSSIVRLARLMFAIKSSVFGLASGW